MPDPDDAVGFPEGQRLEEDPIDQTEHGDVGSDAEGQNADGDNGEAGIAHQRSQPVSRIPQQVLDPAETPAVAMLFLDLLDCAEAETRGPAGFFGRQALGYGVPLSQFQVGEDLTFQFLVETPLPEQRQYTSHGAPKSHDDASRKRATRAVACSQFATATRSCLLPALVRE